METQLVKLFICSDTEEEQMEQKFKYIFETMCQNAVPLIGFIKIPSLGGYMVGVKECFEEYFPREKFKLEPINIDEYLEKASVIWLAKLDKTNPLNSALEKLKK